MRHIGLRKKIFPKHNFCCLFYHGQIATRKKVVNLAVIAPYPTGLSGIKPLSPVVKLLHGYAIVLYHG